MVKYIKETSNNFNMKYWILLLVSLLVIPFTNAESLQLSSTATTFHANDQVNVNLYIDANSFIGYEFDIEYDENLLSYNSHSYNAVANADFQNLAPDTSNPGILSGFGGYTDPQNPTANPGSAGTYLTISFTASSSNEGNTRINISGQKLINSSNNGDDENPLPTTIQGVTVSNLAITISLADISFTNPVIPETVNTDDLVNITYKIEFNENYDTVQVFPPAQFTGNNYWILSNGVISPVNYVNSKIELTLNLGTDYNLIQEVQTPTTVFGTLTEDELTSVQEFTLEGPNAFNSVDGNITVNESYPYVWLYQFDGADWLFLNPTNLVNLENNQVTFENLVVDEPVENLRVVGNKTCVSVWSAWSSCVGGIATRTDANYCAYPYIQTTGSVCEDDDDDNTGGGGGGGGGGGSSIPEVETEHEETYEFDDDVYEVVITYMGLSRYDFKVDYEDIDLALENTAPYKGFEIYSTYEELSEEKISEAVIKFRVNEFWMENNNIDDIEIYQRNGNEWNKLTSSGSDGEYTAYSNSIGTFAVIGLLSEVDVQTPGVINIAGGSEEEETIGIKSNSLSFQNFLLPIIIGVVVLTLAIGGVVVSARHPAKHGNPKDVPKAKMEKVVDYVNKARTSGMNDEKIIANLKSVGWSKEVVEAAIKSTNPSNPGKPAA